MLHARDRVKQHDAPFLVSEACQRALQQCALVGVQTAFLCGNGVPLLLAERFFTRKGQMGGNSQKICMIVEGTRCTASYHEQPLPLYEADLDPDMCQDSTFDKEKIIAQAKRVAMRIMRRHSGHIITSMEVASYRPFYRPYYVAFYGEMEMGKKVRYIAIEADGYKTDSSL